ncbi:MAG: hypothetical protein KKH40_01665 [Nanoarchaeota archaeon]|nr:hypothetical protein [Nanoarchaeota archaeon]
MIPKNTKKIILFLIKHFNTLGFNINQISKETEISVGSSFKILKNLERDDLITKEEISNASYYKLNLDNQETIKLCELLLLGEKRELQGYAKLYAKDIDKFEDADLIILFGSILKKNDFKDVDALFLTDKVKKTAAFCLKMSSIRIKPIVPLIMRKEDFIRDLKDKSSAISGILKESVLLKGETILMEMMADVNKK